MVRVGVLGGLAVEVDGRAVTPPRGRCAALLAWLALHPGMQPRARVAAGLWPDVLDESARRSLRTALLDLRAELGDAAVALHATRDELGLAPEVEVDVQRFDAAVAAGALEDALALAGGVLAPELEQDWAADARREHEAVVTSVLERLADGAEAEGDLPRAIAFARRLVTLDPLSEEHARALVRRLAAAGDRAAALIAFDEHRELLRARLGVAPSVASRALLASLRDEGPAAEAHDPEPAAAPAPLPAALALATGHGTFVGRAAQLGALRDAFDAAGDGTLRVCLVTGEAGVGKTRLVGEFAAEAARDGARVLHGACLEDPRPPYAPFLAALEAEAAGLAEPALRARLGHDAAVLAPLVPAVAERLGLADPDVALQQEADQLRLFGAIGSFLRAAAAPRLVLVVEDVHWAAESTLRLLLHLARAGRGRVLVVATSRDTAPDVTSALSAFLADAERLPAVTRVPLGGLDLAEVEAVLRAAVGRAPIDLPRTARRLHEATAGSPLFLREVVRMLPPSGPLALPVSPTLRDQVVARFARVAPEDDEVLDAAAVLGADFGASGVAAVLDRPVDGVLDALDRAASLGVVLGRPDAPGRFAFSHALVRDVRLGLVPAGRRLRLHRAAARALAASGTASSAELARHFCAAAELGDADVALRHARDAAREARARFAFADAAAGMARAREVAELVPDLTAATRCELAIEHGELLHRAGDLGHREVLLGAAAQARALRRPDLLGRVAIALAEQGWTSAAGVEDPDVLSVTREALEHCPPQDDARRARLLSAIAAGTHLTVDHHGARDVATEALACARRSGDPSALGETLVSAHWACLDPLNMDERMAWTQEALAVAEAQEDLVLRNQALRMLGQNLLEAADLAGARAAFADAGRLADALDIPYLRVYGPGTAAAIAVLEGRLEEAGRRLRECSALARRIGVDPGVYFGGAGLGVLLESGMWEQALDGLQRAWDRAPGLVAFRATVGMLLARLGRHDEAISHVAAITADDFAALPRNIQWAPAMVLLADAAVHLDDRHTAAAVRELLLPVAGTTPWAGFTALAPVDLALAQTAVVTGQHDAAVVHLDDAAALCDRLGLPLHRVRVDVHRAWALTRAGDPEAERAVARAVAAAGAAPFEGVRREAALLGVSG